MKTKIIIILFTLFIMSCSQDIMNEFRFDREWFADMKEACEWIHENIEYRKTDGLISPERVLKRGYGDCADMGALLMAIVGYQHKNYYSLFVVLDTKVRHVKHVVIEYQGRFYDCTRGETVRVKQSEIDYKWDHYKTMMIAY